MIPRTLIDTARIPGGDEMKLFRRASRQGDDFMIVIDRNELMSTRMNGSEITLGESCRRVAGRVGARVLIGGLGMGFTLRAALGVLARDAAVVVAELVPEVIGWARGPLAGVFAGILDDPRVDLRQADVAAVIAGGGHDAILLDVDNGPDGLVRAGNDRLYSPRGLAAARAALTPGGMLAVWSAAPDAKFARSLREAGFAVEETVVAARVGGKGPRHTIWYATRS